MEHCPWCGENPANWGKHALTECKGGTHTRPTGNQEGEVVDRDEELRGILADLGSKNIRKVMQQMKDWITKLE